jgi:hypothetical protein
MDSLKNWLYLASVLGVAALAVVLLLRTEGVEIPLGVF